ncbi:hypothetical protein N7470_001997 [Penicillium chermesinum]|nr:hypothetical protein N7470_001997 [Penicillium chermesinum]
MRSPVLDRLLAFLILSAFIAQNGALATKCYSRDGTVYGSDVQPCHPSAQEGACCATNKHDQGVNDTCLSNNLCYSQDGVSSGLFYEVGCTKSDWASSACSFVCKDMKRNYLLEVLRRVNIL